MMIKRSLLIVLLLARPAWGAEIVARSVTLAEQNRPSGRALTSAFTPTVVEARCRLTIEATMWDDPALDIVFGLERSFDAGATWQHWVSGTTVGGSRGRLGTLPSVAAPMYAGQNYAIRGFIQSSKQATLGLRLDTFPGSRETLVAPQEPHSWADTGRKNKAEGQQVGSLNVTLTGTVAGNFLAAGGSQWDNAPDAPTSVAVSDDVNGAYTSSVFSSLNDQAVSLHYVGSGAGGNITVTQTPAPAATYDTSIFIHEFSGGHATPASGTPVTATGTSTAPATGAMTPADNDVLLLSVLGFDNTGTITENAGTEGFTLSNETEFSGTGQPGSMVFKILVGAPGTPSHSWTTENSGDWAVGIAAFKPASASSPRLVIVIQ